MHLPSPFPDAGQRNDSPAQREACGPPQARAGSPATHGEAGHTLHAERPPRPRASPSRRKRQPPSCDLTCRRPGLPLGAPTPAAPRKSRESRGNRHGSERKETPRKPSLCPERHRHWVRSQKQKGQDTGEETWVVDRSRCTGISMIKIPERPENRHIVNTLY